MEFRWLVALIMATVCVYKEAWRTNTTACEASDSARVLVAAREFA